jgi:hypothetical protein
MDKPRPIACTLGAAERPKRAADIRRLGEEALVSVERGDRRAILRFRREPGIRERVDALVAAESRCCAFLGFDVAEEPEATVLTITAPAGGEAIVHGLADLLAAEGGPASQR